MVSKTAVLLTEWVFEGDLVSKMADLLTEKGVRCATTGLLRKHCASKGATITPTRLASCGRECPRRGLGGFVGFRQLPGRFGEIGRFCECEWPDLSDRPTTVTAKNLRSRRADFLACARGPRATRAESGVGCRGCATREGFADEAMRGQSSIKIFQKIAGRGRRRRERSPNRFGIR